jgi:hypothetical protein
MTKEERQLTRKQRAALAHKIRDSLRRQALTDSFSKLLEILKADQEARLASGIKLLTQEGHQFDEPEGVDEDGNEFDDEDSENEDEGGNSSGKAQSGSDRRKGTSKRGPNRINILQKTLVYVADLIRRNEELDDKVQTLRQRLQSLRAMKENMMGN